MLIEHMCCICKYRWQAEYVDGITCEKCPVCGTFQEVQYVRPPAPDERQPR